MDSLVWAMSEMTPSVMMRSTKYWEPSFTEAAYLHIQLHTNHGYFCVVLCILDSILGLCFLQLTWLYWLLHLNPRPCFSARRRNLGWDPVPNGGVKVSQGLVLKCGKNESDDLRVNLCNVSGDANFPSVSSDKEGADLKGTAPELLHDSHFYPHLWSQAEWSGWKSEIWGTDCRSDFVWLCLPHEACSSGRGGVSNRNSSSKMSQRRWHGHLLRTPPGNPRHARGTVHLSWPVKALGSPQRRERNWQGKQV